MHGDASFVTLTYSEENLPSDGSLDPRSAQLFLKRLRARMAPKPLRFFLVGEYGEETRRPHYHAALFGMPNCARGRTDHRLERCCHWCELVKGSWGLGGVDCREVSMETAQYLVGYVVKKMTRVDDSRLQGLTPEFARMSLRPGIGALAVTSLLSSLADARVKDRLAPGESLRVPRVLKHGSRSLPLGRYLRAKLRATGEFIDERELVAIERAQELSAVSARHGTAKAVAALKLGPEVGLVDRFERKAKLFAKKGSL